jgi:hypothetical protein
VLDNRQLRAAAVCLASTIYSTCMCLLSWSEHDAVEAETGQTTRRTRGPMVPVLRTVTFRMRG